MTKEKRNTVIEEYDLLTDDNGTVPISELIDKLTKFTEQGYSHARCTYGWRFDENYGVLMVVKERLENDEEYQKRLNMEQNQVKHRRNLYERLKKEFGN